MASSLRRMIRSFTVEELAHAADVSADRAAAFMHALAIEFGDVNTDFVEPHSLRTHCAFVRWCITPADISAQRLCSSTGNSTSIWETALKNLGRRTVGALPKAPA